MSHLSVSFIGSARYAQPLDETSKKKFSLLQNLGEFFVIGFSRDWHWKHFKEHASFYLLPELPIAILRYAEMFVLGPLLTLWLIFRYRVQVLVAQSPYEGFVAAIAKYIGNLFGAKVVLIIESHGDFQEGLFLQRSIHFQRIYRYFMVRATRFALSQADLLRAISQATGRQLNQWTSDKPILIFPTWTNIEVFLQGIDREKERTRQDILYAGVLTPLKGVHHLVNAFASVAKDYPDAKLIIVGREENQTYSNGLKHLINQLDLASHVQFIGEVSQRDLAVWMWKARVLVLPSLSEGLGRVVIEAMATGTPVIGSDVGGIKELVEDGGTGFRVPPGDEKALADRLCWILKHPEEARDMGRRAEALAKNLFSAEGYIQGYQRLFEAAQTLRASNGDRASPAL